VIGGQKLVQRRIQKANRAGKPFSAVKMPIKSPRW
jgi:hypothetical protein